MRRGGSPESVSQVGTRYVGDLVWASCGINKNTAIFFLFPRQAGSSHSYSDLDSISESAWLENFKTSSWICRVDGRTDS